MIRSKTPSKPEASVAPSTKERALTAAELQEKRIARTGGMRTWQCFCRRFKQGYRKIVWSPVRQNCLVKKKVMPAELKPEQGTVDMTIYKSPGENSSQTPKDAAKLRQKALLISQAKELSGQTSQSSSQASSKPSQSTPSDSPRVSRYQASEEEQRQFASNYGNELVITISPSKPTKR